MPHPVCNVIIIYSHTCMTIRRNGLQRKQQAATDYRGPQPDRSGLGLFRVRVSVGG